MHYGQLENREYTFFASNCDESPMLTEFLRLQSTNLNVFHAQLCITTTVHFTEF